MRKADPKSGTEVPKQGSGISYKHPAKRRGEGVFKPRWVSFSPAVSSRADPGKPKVTEATADGPSAFDLADVPGHEGTGQALGTHPKNRCGSPIPSAPPQPYGHSMPTGMWTQPGPSQVQMQTSRERAAGCASPHSASAVWKAGKM